MTVNIEKMRTDMASLQRQLAWETRKFNVQVMVGIAACIGVGVALANYVNSRAPSLPAPTPVYVVPSPAAANR